MIIYSVAVTIDMAIECEWLDWMRQVHVPEVIRSGCFKKAIIYRLVEPESNGATYVIQYRCSSLQEYHKYRDGFAPALKKKHSDRFHGRFRASRQLLEEVCAGEA